MEALRPEVLDAAPAALRRRVALFAHRLLEDHRKSVRDVPVADRPWPPHIGACVVDWGDQIRRRLTAAGLTDDRQIVAHATYAELLSRPGLGARTVYEIAVAAQMALDRVQAGVKLPVELGELARLAAASPWAGLVSGEDPRFSDLFVSGGRTLADLLDAAASSDADTAREATFALGSILPAAFERIAGIDESSLGDGLRNYVQALSGLNGELLDAVMRRCGLDGRPPQSLPQAVKGARVSTERLRQLQVRLLERAPSHQVYMPALDRALELLNRAAPTSAGAVARSLQLRGITASPFHPASVIAAARLCGRSVDLEVDDGAGGEFVVRRAVQAEVSNIIRIASHRAASFGAVSFGALVSGAASSGAGLSEADVRDVVSRCCQAEFLDDDWFWLPERGQNRLRALTRRIVSVTSPLDVAAVRAGLCRAYGRRNAEFIPPEHVLAGFYDGHPDFEVDPRGRVRAVAALDYRTELGKNDRIFVEVLRAARDGVLDRASFHERCVATGMSSSMFGMATKVSVVLDNPFHDAWCLRGTQVSPAVALALRRRRSAGHPKRRVRAFGQRRNGAIWFAVTLPRRPGVSLVVHVPAAVARDVRGRRFRARANDGSDVGTVVVNDAGSAWGFGRFLAHAGDDEHGVLLVQLDPRDESAVLKLEDR